MNPVAPGTRWDRSGEVNHLDQERATAQFRRIVDAFEWPC
jgi:hypothetical protein